jgi:hypothetical protein
LSHPLAGDVIGFALRWEGQEQGVLWISGDTVLYDGLRQVADRMRHRHSSPGGRAIPHLGADSLHHDGSGRRRVCRAIRPSTAIPIHYEGWKHFQPVRKVGRPG